MDYVTRADLPVQIQECARQLSDKRKYLAQAHQLLAGATSIALADWRGAWAINWKEAVFLVDVKYGRQIVDEALFMLRLHFEENR